jgi:putative transcriptional regulator
MTKRDIGKEILDSIHAIKSGEGKTYSVASDVDAKQVREKLNLGRSAFAALMGVSPRTVRAWERGERKPSGAARILLLMAAQQPDLVLATVRHRRLTS